ncbi:MAG: hypothetical protein ACK6CP_16485 [Pseudanabaena sp.]|jgi:hypothetical protein|nr:hypothetical protein [Pseudanabaena sp. M090S1SP2A07QC]MCA6508315.1 hypothetical protein [Pseudanabaena sp. M172S2SP2A07QC]MCA6520318.1 hypothetical protein [Pseudanabaena sp. M051S1SP2A07QC]MCA6527707.1 hypothetical protein [Pseudanabaena sp. M179S2SP2A07QC]MCA6530886.1 hypothetical protein [Pseudanabaena sp. M125S2SP2A07QC]MCA6534587.1 hypothetical protein [Pseudanabaena sp. M176S2SP2A07QC]MCA6538712.1 hypothetical protein [Pseudanabaena sp. M037S2SP2A07QC]MCA6546043.1 hypothetical prot
MSKSAYLLLVETSAIVSTNPNTWQAIAKLGECLLPEVVAIEIKNIANGKAEGNESNAKQFQNSSDLNWQVTTLTAKHADLVIRATQNLSRQARVMINVAQSAVGVANAHPTQCVVLISDEISLRDRIAKLESKNLCAIPSAVARQWSRTDQAPPIVYQSIKYLQKQISEAANQFPRQTDTIYLGASSSSLNAEQKIKDNQKANPNYGQIAIILVKFGLATTFSVAILLFGWRLAQPQQFQQFWKKNGLPPLPKVLLQPNQTNKN